RRSNLKFAHELVPIMTRPAAGQADPPECVDCHSDAGAPWMTVRAAIPERCLDCHGVKAAHFAAPDTACASCHIPLVRAVALTREDVAGFPAPPSHREMGFRRGSGHGVAAASGSEGVAASCATCHARDFCLSCHVDGPEQPAIQALGPDPRSLAIEAHLAAPQSHARADFLQRHGAMVRDNPAACRTCHARESCFACHSPTSRVAVALLARGPGRSAGAMVTRRPPASHQENFAEGHRTAAAAVPATCAGCHVRADCFTCHLPNAGTAPGYHPTGFLSRHPAAAYAREASCSDCHNTGGFCVSCHAEAGLTARATLGSGYHDAKRYFVVGHGQAARQSLESCVGCHVERDCLTCHAALGGRGFNPHGPGFDAARLRRKNPEMCTACHGAAIPAP
ncbi:MAG TPA: cytochrome c3 family protein, partial [Gemmatimonadales bacterium]